MATQRKRLLVLMFAALLSSAGLLLLIEHAEFLKDDYYVDVNNGRLLKQRLFWGHVVKEGVHETEFSTLAVELGIAGGTPDWRLDTTKVLGIGHHPSPNYHLHGAHQALRSLADTLDGWDASTDDKKRLLHEALQILRRDTVFTVSTENGVIRLISN